jgi:1-acyl-sn-glycerol-3-phosphate acyltransferase
LTDISVAEILKALGLTHLRRGRTLLESLLRPTAHRFAMRIMQYEHIVDAAGLQAGGQWLLKELVRQHSIVGEQNIPHSGPLLVVANHPGLYDAVALYASLPRPDLRIVAIDKPFLRALPHTSRHLLLLNDEPASRLPLVRRVARHLRAGGAVLLFPGGSIEPDPAVLPGAAAALASWSNSMEVFVRLVPELTVVPAVVSGVISPFWLRNPITRVRRNEADQRWLAATLQLLRTTDVHVRVTYGSPMRAADLSNSERASSVSREVLAVMRNMVEQAQQAEPR